MELGEIIETYSKKGYSIKNDWFWSVFELVQGFPDIYSMWCKFHQLRQKNDGIKLVMATKF